MRTYFLLGIGIVFLSAALAGPAYLFLREKLDLQSAVDFSEGIWETPTPTPTLTPTSPPTHTPSPTATEAPPPPPAYNPPPPPPTDTPTDLPTTQPSSTSEYHSRPGSGSGGSYLIEAEWPARIEVRQSATIRISLLTGANGYTPTVEIQGNTASVSTLISVGTPGSALRSAFGEEYEAYAVAHIAGPSFDIELASPSEPQSLDQPRVEWVWNIWSDNPGLQSLDISIEIEWKRVGQVEEPESRQIWRSHLPVEIFQPVISRGQVNVLSIVSGFLGTGLSIPWIHEIINKRKPQQPRKDKKRR